MTEFMRKTYIVNLNKYTLKKHNLKQAFYVNYMLMWFSLFVYYNWHYSLFLLSIKIVTGPSLTKATFMSAPNAPVFIGF